MKVSVIQIAVVANKLDDAIDKYSSIYIKIFLTFETVVTQFSCKYSKTA